MRYGQEAEQESLRLEVLLRWAAGEELQGVGRGPVLRALGRGELGRGGYARLLAELQAVYAELEWGLEWHGRHPAVRPFALGLGELGCNELLQDDLRALLGPGWYGQAEREGAREHVERLRVLGDEAPGLLAAHAWVLYAGVVPALARAVPRVAWLPGLRGAASTCFLRQAARLEGAEGRALVQEALERLERQRLEPAALAAEAQVAARLVRRLFEPREVISRATSPAGSPATAAVPFTPWQAPRGTESSCAPAAAEPSKSCSNRLFLLSAGESSSEG